MTATAELLTSEVVTNLVVHVGEPGELVVRESGDRFRFEVIDHNREMPGMQGRSRDGTSGRGLYIVDAFSQAWGVEMVPEDGKTVWFELAP